jgi:hypothetical protein
MIEYYNNLPDEEKEELTGVIKVLFSQTFLLERRYDKKTERYLPNRQYRVCEKHLDFLKSYFLIGDVDLVENRQYGIMALRTQNQQGDKLSKLTTIFILLLKLIFEEQMNTVSNSIHVYTTLNEVYDKINLFRLWNNKAIPITEVRKTTAVLKRYQVIELLDETGDLEGDTKIIIYPTVNLVINQQAVADMITQYQENEEEEDDDQISSPDEDLSEQLALY